MLKKSNPPLFEEHEWAYMMIQGVRKRVRIKRVRHHLRAGSRDMEYTYDIRVFQSSTIVYGVSESKLEKDNGISN